MLVAFSLTLGSSLKLWPSKKSWWLSDAAKIAKEAPYTFHKPSSKAVSLLKAGDSVKLIFRFRSDNPEHPQAERMWVEITQGKNGRFEGMLDNEPYYIADIVVGDKVRFSEKHIIQVSIDDPVPSKIDRYLPRCFVTSRVLKDGEKIRYLYREEPEFENDSGWRISAGDESEEYMDDSNNISWVSLGAVLRKDDSVLHLIDEPVGKRFERRSARHKFVEITK